MRPSAPPIEDVLPVKIPKHFANMICWVGVVAAVRDRAEASALRDRAFSPTKAIPSPIGGNGCIAAYLNQCSFDCPFAVVRRCQLALSSMPKIDRAFVSSYALTIDRLTRKRPVHDLFTAKSAVQPQTGFGLDRRPAGELGRRCRRNFGRRRHRRKARPREGVRNEAGILPRCYSILFPQ